MAFPKIYCDVAEIYRWRWLEESGLRLENVDLTHVVLASGKLELQKNIKNIYLPIVNLELDVWMGSHDSWRKE